MPKPPNELIKGFIGPDERPSVVFTATRPLPRGTWPVGVVVLSFASRIVENRFGDGWSVTSVAPLLGILAIFLVSLERLWRSHHVGVVSGDIVVVRPRMWLGRDRLIGRWSSQAAAPEILGSRFIRIRIAGGSYWIESDDAIRARLAINNVNRTSAAIDC